MPKTRARKRGQTPLHSNALQSRQRTGNTQGKTIVRGKKTANPRAKSVESLLMPSLVALGCWGLAFSFIFLTFDANHYLYGGMAVVMAIMWTVMVGMRIARMRHVHPNASVHQ